ncbi:MAG: pyrimidine 5'-nucleotidase [Neisseria sp.]|nr:pyrimidine 5'-nucleotidase [Neisseria sp.]
MQPIFLFDLDNTLHNANAGIFDLINRRMTLFLAEHLRLNESDADVLRQDYWQRYGATLAGLRLHHAEILVWDFLCDTHPLPEILALLEPEAQVGETLCRLHGKKAVFSNGPSFYIDVLLRQMEIKNEFVAEFGIDTLNYAYKPHQASFDAVCAQLNVAPQDCVLIDDSLDNLQTAKSLGMMAVWYGKQAYELPFLDGAVADMAQLLEWAKARAWA